MTEYWSFSADLTPLSSSSSSSSDSSSSSCSSSVYHLFVCFSRRLNPPPPPLPPLNPPFESLENNKCSELKDGLSSSSSYSHSVHTLLLLPSSSSLRSPSSSSCSCSSCLSSQISSPFLSSSFNDDNSKQYILSRLQSNSSLLQSNLNKILLSLFSSSPSSSSSSSSSSDQFLPNNQFIVLNSINNNKEEEDNNQRENFTSLDFNGIKANINNNQCELIINNNNNNNNNFEISLIFPINQENQEKNLNPMNSMKIMEVEGKLKIKGEEEIIIKGQGDYSYQYIEENNNKENEMNNSNSLIVPLNNSPSSSPFPPLIFTLSPSLQYNQWTLDLNPSLSLLLSSQFDTVNQSFVHSELKIKNNSSSSSSSSSSPFTLSLVRSWFSVRTGNIYPVAIRLLIPQLLIDLNIEGEIDQSEILSFLSPNLVSSSLSPAYWYGRMKIIDNNLTNNNNNNNNNNTSSGHLFVSNVCSLMSLESFFKQISNNVSSLCQSSLSLQSSPSSIAPLLCSPSITSSPPSNLSSLPSSSFSHLLTNLNLSVYNETLIAPLRSLIDRGGKSWRSLALLLSIDCCGGWSVSPHYSPSFLVFPEIMHVGSLIIDDIEDNSGRRRGGPSVHSIIGNSLAINAGSHAYFLAFHLLQLYSSSSLSPCLLSRLYTLYFQLMRAGHCGQGIDIFNFNYLLNEEGEVVNEGESAQLEGSIRSCHRLKSGIAAGILARMGGMVGGGGGEEVEALGLYFESIGLAFQMIDDCLNIEGFEDGKKEKAEDIMAGKVTYPIAKLLNKNKTKEKEKRKKIASILNSKSANNEEVEWLIEQCKSSGVLEESRREAKQLIELSWQAVNQLFPISLSKLLLRAFGSYVVSRKV